MNQRSLPNQIAVDSLTRQDLGRSLVDPVLDDYRTSIGLLREDLDNDTEGTERRGEKDREVIDGNGGKLFSLLEPSFAVDWRIAGFLEIGRIS